ncbi:uncharacterized protein LOC112203387 [Rosa chinensis]|uniref:uncharacterized protein LOC112203387 n=1 Tax=Rosa chinensis TaxID=74649 RepID=UPI000D093B19|nr:uncharacterized protein LOC112203387 [Rosa chinensis]
MSIETTDEKLMCKIFPSNLTGTASTWFQDLKQHSIPDFNTLSRAFISQYFYNCKQKKDMATLFSTKQKPGEKVGKFFERFKAVMHHVNCDPQFAAITFQEGFLLGTLLCESLLCDLPKDMDDIIKRVQWEIRIEKAKEAREVQLTTVVTSREVEWNNAKNDIQSDKGGKPQDYSLEEWFTIHPMTIYKRHSHEAIFEKPPPPPNRRLVTRMREIDIARSTRQGGTEYISVRECDQQLLQQ